LVQGLSLRIVAILLAVVLTACSTTSGQVVSTGERYTAVAVPQEDYRLGIGDKLRVNVFRQESLSGEFQINSDGNLSFPLIGDVKALGATVAQVNGVIRDRLAEGYLKDPRVSIEVINFRPYFILGEVKTPGQYPYSINLTVMNAIATAQGKTPRADGKAVWIRKSGEENEALYRLTPDLKVQPGDTIRIGERLF
jgi:polysaccharide export outer membrane protein